MFKRPIGVCFEPPVLLDKFAVVPMKLKDSPTFPATSVQVYTGNGKGKTTASMGLMLRASGAGMKSYFGQFMKKAK